MNRLNRFFHSRNCTALIYVVAVVLTYVAYQTGQVRAITGSQGIALQSPNSWITSGGLSLAAGLVLLALTAVSFVALNKVYNVMREPSALMSSLYVVMVMSMPMAAGQVYGGVLLSGVMLAVVALMFSCYGDTTANRRVYITFFIMSLAALVQYTFVFYLPIVIVGLAQMRILNVRSLLAMLMGVVSTVWILYGVGAIGLSDIEWPRFASTLSQQSVTEKIVSLTAVGLTMILGFAAMCANLMKMLSYNAKFRAYNGFLTVIFLSTMLFMAIDYSNYTAYFPILSLTAAYQMAHYFAMRKQRGIVWVILAVMVAYLGIYAVRYFV